MSLTSRGGGSVCSSMASSPRSRYGADECTPRRFSSRHVPKVAEELAQRTETLTSSAVSQFHGLMKYLKPNSEWEERQKSALASDMEAMVPEELDEALRGEFDRRCAFGERLNTELMSSAKWAKVLKDIGAVAAPGDSPKKRSASGTQARLMTSADPDIIFHKVLHNCDHGGKRLTFDLFCKALYLAGQAIRPDLEGEAALAELVGRVVEAAPPESQELVDGPDCMLDSNVLLVLDTFKPALHDLHTTFCRYCLEDPSQAARGRGTVRMRERSFWKHTQGTDMSFPTGATQLEDTSRLSGDTSRFSERGESQSSTQDPSTPGGSPLPAADENSNVGWSQPAAGSPKDSVVKGLGDFCLGSPTSGFNTLPTLLEGACDKIGSGSPLNRRMQSPSATIANELWGDSMTMMSRATTADSDPYVYANGAPVIKSRRRMMSLEQWLALNKQLEIMPEFLSRLEVVNIFKRAQCSGQTSSHGGSTWGYLNQEAFVEAVGLLAMQAYAKEPYCDEFPGHHDRIHGFLLRVLPHSSRTLHERYGGQRL
eukprot:CAMPEP_0195103592 /NCGR_PEP_ID=MMETSP0448-20130528/72606_1 /TAXON_ID=66468 /ORGANISM="Heterocapsa triquestra, Strain CCMP 448" /LENGTH=539 /DNA_ID=CAMNT_0040139307 /DNA_START=137 /DNA_END=1756 /DNA_ORIENTATION=+